MRGILFTLLVSLSLSVGANESFQVLGSYAQEDAARQEGQRISHEAGIEVLLQSTQVDGASRYRLLTAPGADAAASTWLSSRLEQAGVTATWALHLDGDIPYMETIFPDPAPGELGLVEIDALSGNFDADIGSVAAFESEFESEFESAFESEFESEFESAFESESEPGRMAVERESDYLVVGSFRDSSNAAALAQRIDTQADLVRVELAEISGTFRYRVLVGPITPGEVATRMQALAAIGINDAWVLRGQPLPPSPTHQFSTDLAPDDLASEALQLSPPSQASQLPQLPQHPPDRTKSETWPGEDSDFNLARLKKKSIAFPSPGQKDNLGRWRTDVAGEFRLFDEPGLNDLESFHGALSIQAEYYKTWNQGNDIFAFVPFVRWDAEDKERSHLDIRELTRVHVGNDWELRTGIRKVFWGVTESRHLVDIINQTDNVENPDGEEKLGQPMINLSLTRDWGIIDVYLLTGFRERNFPGEYGRPRLPFLVDEDEAVYESGAEEYRTDFAARWSHYIGDLEIGLSHFSGTSREPRFQLNLRTDTSGSPVLIPVYDVIDQTGLDAQYFIGDWAWKLEAITRSGQEDRFAAATFGFEKTFVGVLGGRSDLGIVAEYLYDDRGAAAPVIGEDDLALGFRYTMNNPADTTALLVWLHDLDSDEYLVTFEASGRIGENWKLVLEASVFSNADAPGNDIQSILRAFSSPDSELSLFQDEDFFKLELIRYF